MNTISFFNKKTKEKNLFMLNRNLSGIHLWITSSVLMDSLLCICGSPHEFVDFKTFHITATV